MNNPEAIYEYLLACGISEEVAYHNAYRKKGA